MELGDVYVIRVESLRDLIEVHDREVAMLERKIHRLLRDNPGYQTIQVLNGVGRTAAIFVAEIGDVSRFRSAEALCSWAGLAPWHRESDTTLVYYGLRDGEIRLCAPGAGGGVRRSDTTLSELVYRHGSQRAGEAEVCD
jgi:transposase